MTGRATAASFACLLSLMLANAHAGDSANAGAPTTGEPVAADVFQDVQILSKPDDWYTYPSSERSRGREGLVTLNMMISPSGKPYEVTVLDSSGIATLDEAAVKALDQMSFQAARIGQTAVDSSFTMAIKFSIYGTRTIPPYGFQSTYRKLTKAIEAHDRKEADAELGKLQPETLSEDAITDYARYLYDHQWGTEAGQLKDLEPITRADGLGQFLGRALFTNALVAQFILKVKYKEYASALATWNAVKPLVSPATRGVLQQAVDKITVLRDSNDAVTTSESIPDDRTSWHDRLFKKRFALAVKSGAVSEIKLRCQRKYLLFHYEPGVQYSITPQAGECGIEVVGNPGTTFKLTQS